MSAVSEGVQQAAVWERHSTSAPQQVSKQVKTQKSAPNRGVATCDDRRVVFAAGHLQDTPLFKVLHGPRQRRLEDERPVTELPELPEAEREHVVIWKAEEHTSKSINSRRVFFVS